MGIKKKAKAKLGPSRQGRTKGLEAGHRPPNVGVE
jgi:hypothetical protein